MDGKARRRLWALDPASDLITEAVMARQAASEGQPESMMAGERLEGSDFARVVDGVAIVPVRGALLRSFNWAFWSYEEIRRDVALADADRRVKAIVIEIDSPGGLGAGCSDLADWLRTGVTKPLVAFVGSTAASAAYWLASACDEIVLGSGAMVGSIGVVIEYVDIEPMLEKMGARIVRVVAEQSPNKRLEPGSDAERAELAAIVNEMCDDFLDSVAEGRGVTRAVVQETYGQGLVFAPREAVSRGMAERSATLEDLIAELAGRDVQSATAPAAVHKETTMKMDWESLTSAGLRENRADIVEELTAEAVAAATATANAASAEAATAAATAERERILAIDAVAVEGYEELVAAAKADGKTTAAELSLSILAAMKKAGATALASRKSDDAQIGLAATPRSGSEPVIDPSASVEDRAKAAWDKDAALRAEFGSLDAYLAFEKAQAAGRARIKSTAH